MPAAPSAPPDPTFYRDRGAFDRLRETAFVTGWHGLPQAAGLADGRVRPVTLHPGFLDEPLVAVGEAPRLLANVCTHRGNLVVTEEGSPRELRCGYHGRRFGLDGACRGMAGMEEVSGFPGEQDALPSASVTKWAGVPFAALDPQRPFDALVAAVRDRIDGLPEVAGRSAPTGARTYEVAAHWTLYVENYLEGLHVPYVHPQLAGSLAGYEVESHPGCVLQVGLAADGEPALDLPSDHPDAGRRIAAYYVWVWPATMVNVYPWGVSVNVVTPLDLDRTRVVFTPFVARPDLVVHGAGGALDHVEEEDEAVVEQVQRGARARLARPGPLVPGAEDGVAEFRARVRAALGV